MYNLLITFLVLAAPIWALADSNTTEPLPNLENNTGNVSVLNDMLRQTNRRLLSLEGGISINSATTGILTTSRGGTSADLSAAAAGTLPYFSSTGLMGNVGIGTSGYVLTSQGAGAPYFALPSNTSNVIFVWLGADSANTSTDVNFGNQYFGGTNNVPAVNTDGIYSFFGGRSDNSAYHTVLPAFKWRKISGVSTLTCYLRVWNDSAAGLGSTVRLNVNAAALSGSVSINSVTPTLQSPITVNVSSLVNGTVYDILVDTTSNDTNKRTTYLSGIVILGS